MMDTSETADDSPARYKSEGSTQGNSSNSDSHHTRGYIGHRWTETPGTQRLHRKATMHQLSDLSDTIEETVTPTLWIPDEGRWSHLARLMARPVISPWFDIVMGVIVVLNAVTVGWEQSVRLQGEKSILLQVCEHCFLVIYIVELMMRFGAYGCKFLDDTWVRFDLALAILGCATSWIVEPIFGRVRGLGWLMVFKICRLLRLARALRSMHMFRELWMLVRGFIASLRTMVHTLFMMTLILYIFACIGVEIIATNTKYHEHPGYQELVVDNFGTLAKAFLTLTQFVLLDNVVYIYRPLIEMDSLLSFYFLALVLTVSIVLVNLVTAVIVNTAIESAARDKEMLKMQQETEKKRLMKKLRQLVVKIDADRSGAISRQELIDAHLDDFDDLKVLLDDIDPTEIFDALDLKGEGELDIDEFCNGMWETIISETPLEVKKMAKQVDSLYQVHSSFQDKVSSILEALTKKSEQFQLSPEKVVVNGNPLFGLPSDKATPGDSPLNNDFGNHGEFARERYAWQGIDELQSRVAALHADTRELCSEVGKLASCPPGSLDTLAPRSPWIATSSCPLTPKPGILSTKIRTPRIVEEPQSLGLLPPTPPAFPSHSANVRLQRDRTPRTISTEAVHGRTPRTISSEAVHGQSIGIILDGAASQDCAGQSVINASSSTPKLHPSKDEYPIIDDQSE